jgi:hypothetical protein
MTLEQLIDTEIERLTVDTGRDWMSTSISAHLVICPTCAAIVQWRNKAVHRRFHTDLVTALTAAITGQPSLVDEPPF